MSSYIGYTPTFQVDTSNQLSDQIISIVSGQAQYTLSFAPTSDNLLIVSVNGTFYVPTVDYYIESNKITFINVAFPSSGTVYIYYLGSNYFRLNTVTDSSIQVNHLSSQLKLFQSQIFTGDSTTTQFTLTFTPGSAYAVLVLLNNVLQKPSVHYNIIDKTLIFVTAPVSGAEIVIRNLGFKGTEETYTIPSQYIVEDMLSPQSIGTIALKDSAVTTIKVADANITFPKLSSQLINVESEDILTGVRRWIRCVFDIKYAAA